MDVLQSSEPKNTSLVPFSPTESPHFVAKPSSSMTVKEKQNVTLPCKATGFPSPVIAWYKDGRVIREERKQFKKRNLEIKTILFENHGTESAVQSPVIS